MNDNERWRAIQEREAKFDGQFWYGVMTTGVYCKPSCASRGAKRENVKFYSSIEAAQRDGLRADLLRVRGGIASQRPIVRHSLGIRLGADDQHRRLRRHFVFALAAEPRHRGARVLAAH